MDFLRQQLIQINERLAGLSASQKMLTAALVVIMIMTLLYWGRFASDRDMVALFPGALQGEELTNVTGALNAKGITYDASGGVVKVQSEKQLEAMAAVTFNEALPANAANAFEQMLEKISPLGTNKEFNVRYKVAKEARLGQMLRLGDSGIRSAMVMITESETGDLVKTDPRVSVTVLTNGRTNRQAIAKAATHLVQNAVIGLDRKFITVNIDGMPISSGSGLSEIATGEMLDLKARHERDAAERIHAFYHFIPGFRVTVTADVDVQTKHEKEFTVDPKNKLSMPIENVTEKSVTTEPPLPAEPGTVPNTAVTAQATPVAAPAGSSTERTEERNEVAYGKKETEISTPAGLGKIVAANVRVPRSYFEQALLKKYKKEPSEEQVDTLEQQDLARIRAELKAMLPAAAEQNITVAEYVDVNTLEASDPVIVAAGATGSLSLLATGHAKEVAVGLLALTSLFMVGRMVKKSAPPMPATPEPMGLLDDLPNLTGTAASGGRGGRNGAPNGKGINAHLDIAGEVMEGGNVMMGQELDEAVLETSQMVDQVSTFVKENPDTAAQLVRRWMNRG